MKTVPALAKAFSRWSWHLRSVPVFVKILGIGALVAALFGGVILLEAQGSMSRVLYQMLDASTMSLARSLVSDLERPMVTGDAFSVKRKLQATMGMTPQLRYVVVRDQDGAVLAHTFDTAVPGDLQAVYDESLWGKTQVLSSREGFIFDAALPILKGYGGSVQVGASDRMIARELSGLNRSVMKALALCVSVGAVLALGLTHVMTQPIHDLVRAADEIRKGNFEVKARVSSDDEVGRLAVAFNEMAESLKEYRREVRDKEQARLALIEKIIQTQEDERKNISRELHDQLGQNLLALLLMVQSCKDDSKPAMESWSEIETNIRRLIDDIHRLIQGMRPPILDDYGLSSALARLTEEVSTFSGLQIDYQYISSPELGRMPARTELTLYRIAQEAITNVVRHAGAKQASVVVIRRREDVVLLVEDHGCGFDLGSQKDSNRLGLTGMKERTTLLGGSCVLESLPGKGTTVRVGIPLSESP